MDFGEDINISNINVEKELKIVYMGTPEFSATVLEGLLKEYKIRAVVTQPDRQVGRGGKIVYSPVKQVALDNTLLVIQPEKIRYNYEEIVNLNPDLIITCAYGQILPNELLTLPRLGCINVHASLLPKLRGGAPIHRAILNGETKTGVTIMYMDSKMDEGDMISKEEVEITNEDTAETLHDKLMCVGRDLLLKTLPSILDGTNDREKQNNEEATYGFVITKEDEKIDFSKSKQTIYNQIRGLNSWPGSYCLYNGNVLKVWESYITDNVYSEKLNGEITNIYKDGFGVKTQNGEIVFKTVQPAGKKRMNGFDFANGEANKESIIGKILS